MKSLSGTDWGAPKKTQLTIYKALIRSVLDYGCEVYDSASNTLLKKLDSIQYRALKIACGAARGTSLSSLQVETGEPPLPIRRHEQQLKIVSKIKLTPDHVSKSIALDHYRNHYSTKPKTVTIFSKTEDFFNQSTLIGKAQPIQLYPPTPPWVPVATRVELGLSDLISKQNDDPITMRTMTLQYMELYTDTIKVYTDASRTQQDRAAIGIYIPDRDVQISLRVTDGVAICAGELMAIHAALEILNNQNLLATQKITILSDSLSALKIIDKQTGSYPTLLRKINSLLLIANDNITLAWIPSHVGLGGNDEADNLAKKGTEHPMVDVELPIELADVYKEIRDYTDLMWQATWDLCTTNKLNKQINPKVNRRIKFTHQNRRTEILITRFRLGKIVNNHYLFTICSHPTGLCAVCNVKDDIDHTLFGCRTTLVEKLHECCKKHGVPTNFNAVLNDHRTVAIIAGNYRNNNNMPI